MRFFAIKQEGNNDQLFVDTSNGLDLMMQTMVFSMRAVSLEDMMDAA